HGILLRQLAHYRERVAMVVSSALDESETRLFDTFWGRHLQLVGVFHTDGYAPANQSLVLGPTSRMEAITHQRGIERIICANASMMDSHIYQQFCRLRYSGVPVVPLVNL